MKSQLSSLLKLDESGIFSPTPGDAYSSIPIKSPEKAGNSNSETNFVKPANDNLREQNLWRVPDELKERLRPWQIPAVENLRRGLLENGAALDSSDTGTGKTYVACAILSTLKGYDFAIIAPKSVLISWSRVCEYFGITPKFLHNYEKLVRGGVQCCRRIKGKRSQDFVWHLPQNTILVFDEVHRCKGRSSLNSKLMIAAKRQQYPILCMSATVASNPMEMRAIGYALNLFHLEFYWKWLWRNGCKKGWHGGMEFSNDPAVLRTLHSQIFPARGNRLRISDIPEFPSSIVSVEMVDLGDNAERARSAYEDAEKELLTLNNDPSYTVLAMTVLMKARQKTELYKVPVLTEMTHDALEEGLSVVIFANFRETIVQYQKLFPEAGVIQGGQDQDERQRFIDIFQTKSRQVLIANIQAGGVGLSLHDVNGVGQRLSLICPTYSAVQLIQALGRTWRDGSKTTPIQRIIFAGGTIEEEAGASVSKKIKNIRMLNDGIITNDDLTKGLRL